MKLYDVSKHRCPLVSIICPFFLRSASSLSSVVLDIRSIVISSSTTDRLDSRMYGIVIVIVALTVMTSATEDMKKGPCVGCPYDQNIDDPAVLQRFSAVLLTTNTNHEMKKILSVKKQMVAGTKFIVQFETKNDQKCQLSWVEQPWISADPQYVEFNDCKE